MHPLLPAPRRYLIPVQINQPSCQKIAGAIQNIGAAYLKVIYADKIIDKAHGKRCPCPSTRLYEAAEKGETYIKNEYDP